jgi:hypothetical protein
MSDGTPLPAGLTVTLMGYDGMTQTLTQTAPVGADGGYAFPAVENIAGRVFIAEVTYNNMSFNSDIAHPSDAGEKIDLPITLYKTSSDAAQLEIDRMHVFFDFSVPGTVQVVELVLVSNLGESVVVPTAEGQPVLTFDLPEGATNLQFQDSVLGERFIATATGFGDTQSIAPGVGAHQVLFAYDLPYERKLALSLPIGLPVNAAIVMLPVNGTRLQSDQLTDSGTRPVENMTFQAFSSEALPAGSTLKLTITGKPKTEDAGVAAGSTTGIIIAAGVLGRALVAAGAWMYTKSRRQPVAAPEAAGEAAGAEADADSLIDAIAALDDQFHAGKIPEPAYRERRAEMKAQLRRLLGQE